MSTTSLSQWQLIRQRFLHHKLAVAGLFVLVLLYGAAVFAEILAPYAAMDGNLDSSFCPTMPIRFSFGEGFHARQISQQVDPITYERRYLARDAAVPLGFFVKGTPYHLWGLIPMERRFFGVDQDAWMHQHPGTAVPRFHLLGADRFGYDIFSRIIHGSRISLSIGLVAIVVSFILGIGVGGVSGYIGGKTDTVLQRIVEIINAFPREPLWMAGAALIPKHWSPLSEYFCITVVLGLLGWTGLARVVRGRILSLREEDYAVAARLCGASHSRIIFIHLVPGITSHAIVTLTLAVPGMIIGETFLSFLGIGLRAPVISWGVMLQDCLDIKVVATYPWILLPIIFIVLTVLSFNFLGDGLRDAADPYSAK